MLHLSEKNSFKWELPLYILWKKWSLSSVNDLILSGCETQVGKQQENRRYPDPQLCYDSFAHCPGRGLRRERGNHLLSQKKPQTIWWYQKKMYEAGKAESLSVVSHVDVKSCQTKKKPTQRISTHNFEYLDYSLLLHSPLKNVQQSPHQVVKTNPIWPWHITLEQRFDWIQLEGPKYPGGCPLATKCLICL